nr:MAG TPA: hypothetical protein [Caudoviricetes sp.]DAT00539.1 MAG TPA: hypothetical protein [Caudoviricetes sp.]
MSIHDVMNTSWEDIMGVLSCLPEKNSKGEIDILDLLE